MKKILIALVVAFSSLLAGTVTVVNKNGGPVSDEIKGGVYLGVVPYGRTLEFTEERGYYFVEVISNSEHQGSKGFIWFDTHSNWTIIGKGCALNAKVDPETGKAVKDGVKFLFPGAKVKLISKLIYWYKLKGDSTTQFKWGWGNYKSFQETAKK